MMNAILKPGGKIICSDFHPFTKIYDSLKLEQPTGNYFSTDIFEGEMAHARFYDEEIRKSMPKCSYRKYTISEIINSMLRNGFSIKQFDEHPSWEDERLPGEFKAIGINEDQAKAISRAMKDYNHNLIRTQERMLANKKTKTNDDSSSGKYFGVEVNVPSEVRKSTNEYASTDIATNKELIDKIRDSIKSLDINDKDAVNKYKSVYEDIMRTVYTAQYPFQRSSDLDDILYKDINEIMKLSGRV